MHIGYATLGKKMNFLARQGEEPSEERKVGDLRGFINLD